MSESKRLPALNKEIEKGIYVDGFNIGANPVIIIFDGIAAPPRTESPIVVSRMLFPPAMLETLIEVLQKALKDLEGKKVEVIKEERKLVV